MSDEQREQLFKAARDDDVKGFRTLLETPELVNVTDCVGLGLVHMAASHGSNQALRLLVDDLGLSVNQKSQLFRETALMRACASGHLETAKVLVCQYRAKVDEIDNSNTTALCFAATARNGPSFDLVKFLVEEGHATLKPTPHARDPITCAQGELNATAAAERRLAEALALAREAGAEFNNGCCSFEEGGIHTTITSTEVKHTPQRDGVVSMTRPVAGRLQELQEIVDYLTEVAERDK